MKSSLAALCLSLWGCSTTASEPTPIRSQSVQSQVQIGLPGYQHTVNASRFVLGAATTQRSEFGMDKWIGTNGVFSTRQRSGMTLGIANADSPARKKGPLSLDAATHNAAVKAYFVQNGLPEDQVQRVVEQPVMQMGGLETTSLNPSLNPSLGQFDYYFTTIFRQTTSGVAIEDSLAWARINVDGDVIMESVYWPAVDAAVVAEAEAMTKMMADSTTKLAFLAKLPAELNGVEGRVVIRHTSGAWDGLFAARACYDVKQKNRTLHFDSNGVLMRLPSEFEEAYGPTKSAVK